MSKALSLALRSIKKPTEDVGGPGGGAPVRAGAHDTSRGGCCSYLGGRVRPDVSPSLHVARYFKLRPGIPRLAFALKRTILRISARDTDQPCSSSHTRL